MGWWTKKHDRGGKLVHAGDQAGQIKALLDAPVFTQPPPREVEDFLTAARRLSRRLCCAACQVQGRLNAGDRRGQVDGFGAQDLADAIGHALHVLSMAERLLGIMQLAERRGEARD